MATEYGWEYCPQAEALVEEHLARFLKGHRSARVLAERMDREASTRLLDWLDHIEIRGGDWLAEEARATGFVPEMVDAPVGMVVFHHPGAQLPRLVLRLGQEDKAQTLAIGIKVDSIEDFLLTHGLRTSIDGSHYSPYRVGIVWPDGEHRVLVVERRGYLGLLPREQSTDYVGQYLAVRQRWATRPRVTDYER